MTPFTALIGEGGRPGVFRSFRRPVSTVQACSAAEVSSALHEVEAAASSGLCAAGFLAYEAAPGLDSALSAADPDGRPVAWFGLFEGSELVTLDDLELAGDAGTAGASARSPDWRPSMDRRQYVEKVARIKGHLERGDSYQVNFTFKFLGHFQNNSLRIFLDFASDNRTIHSAYIETRDFVILSASPELFFDLNDRRILCRPMKGTSRRGLTTEEDDLLVDTLRFSTKNMAENVMIVDMIRNDLGKICEPGTVRVPSLFDVERFWTVLQMTSTVEGMTTASFSEIMTALFPCASVTGAPKVRTMEIIRQLETGARGVYTGCIGYVLPDRRAKFSVAIRTAWLDVASGSAEYGVGGGVVWDSSASEEYQECLLKAGALTTSVPQFDLLETILWEQEDGYFLLDRHLDRLVGSARYFGYSISLPELEARLVDIEGSMPGPRCKVRVLAACDGSCTIETSALQPHDYRGKLLVEFSNKTVDSSNVFLYHKTTHRLIYENAIDGANCDDVILVNERNEITEFTVGNIVVERDGQQLTPPVESGLLSGTFRGFLLDRRDIDEAVLRPEDVVNSTRIWLINSVWKWTPVTLVTDR